MRAILRRALPAALITAALLGAAAAPADAAPATASVAVATASRSPHLAKPRIVGRPVVGGILIAKVAKPKGARLHYQWRSNGHPIRHATHASFRLRLRDKGHRISVTVRATKRHLRTAKRTSASVRIIAPRTTPPRSAKPPVSAPPALPTGPVSYSAADAPTGREAAIDTHSGTVYSLQDGVTNGGDATIALTAVDAAGGAIERSTNLFTFWGDDVWLWDRDVRIDNRSHTVWALVGGPDGSYVFALDGATLRTEQLWYEPGDVGTLAVDPATGRAYYAAAGACGGSPDRVVSLEAATGSSTSVPLPTSSWCGIGAPNVAFDSANSGVYVAFDGQLFAYSHRLSLASTLTLPGEAGYSLGVTADGDRHRLYVTGTQLYEVAGSTNTISRTAPASSVGRVPVIDPTIHTLYIGKGVYDTDSLGRVGTLPVAADSVDGGTHTIYGTGTIVTRHVG